MESSYEGYAKQSHRLLRPMRWAALAAGLLLLVGIVSFGSSRQASEAATLANDPGLSAITASPDSCVSSSGYVPSYGYGIPGYGIPGYVTSGYGVPGYAGMYGQYGSYYPQMPADGYGGYGTYCTNLTCGGDLPYFGLSYYGLPYQSYNGYGSTYLCPGPAANISVAPNPSIVSCGSQTDINFSITDASGYPVAEGTQVNLSSSLGYITSTVSTSGGAAVASLVIPTKTSGVAQITIYAGGISQQKSVQVSC